MVFFVGSQRLKTGCQAKEMQLVSDELHSLFGLEGLDTVPQ